MPMSGVISGFIRPKEKAMSNPLAKLKVRIFRKFLVSPSVIKMREFTLPKKFTDDI